MEYETLTNDDQIRLAEDALRGIESDYFRLSLLEPNSGRLGQLESTRDEIKVKLDQLKGTPPVSELQSKTVAELKDLADEQGVELPANAKKAEIIEALGNE